MAGSCRELASRPATGLAEVHVVAAPTPDASPLLAGLLGLALACREARHPVAPRNLLERRETSSQARSVRVDSTPTVPSNPVLSGGERVTPVNAGSQTVGAPSASGANLGRYVLRWTMISITIQPSITAMKAPTAAGQ